MKRSAFAGGEPRRCILPTAGGGGGGTRLPPGRRCCILMETVGVRGEEERFPFPHQCERRRRRRPSKRRSCVKATNRSMCSQEAR